MSSTVLDSSDASAKLPPAPVQPTRGTLRTPRWTHVTAKIAMAITGAGLIGFVAMHMLGNLQIYLGQEALNAYAKFLKDMPALLWVARIGLLAIFVIHIALALYLRKYNQQARSQRYVVQDPNTASLASRTMLLSGLVIFAFVIYHLLHFTLGVTDPESYDLVDSAGRHDVYSMVVMSFQNVYVSGSYIIAMLFLGLHLSHAASSMFQTLGLIDGSLREVAVKLGFAVAAILAIGNISIPVAVLTGLVGLPEGVSP